MTSLSSLEQTRSTASTTTSNTTTCTSIKYVPFATTIESSFWVRYCHEKLETIRLNEKPLPVCSSFNTIFSTSGVGVLPKLQFQENSLLFGNSATNTLSQQPNETITPTTDNDESKDNSSNTSNTVSEKRSNNIYYHGNLIGYNTLEAFQKVNKNILLRNHFVYQFLYTITETSTCETINSILNNVLLITFANLKDHTILYWFGIPSLVPNSSSSIGCINKPIQIKNDWDVRRYELFTQSVLSLHDATNSNNSRMMMNGFMPYFIYNGKVNQCFGLSYASYHQSITINNNTQSSSYDLENYIIFVFVDPVGPVQESLSQPSASTATMNMGWPLRNMIAYISFHLNLGGKIINILSYRPKRLPSSGQQSTTTLLEDDESILFKIQVPTKEEYGWMPNDSSISNNNSTTDNDNHINTFDIDNDGINKLYEQYKVVGWELNLRNKPGPRLVNLRPLMDTNHLAIQAADLNLKLMKWRMIPSLNISKLQSCKVLLIGAGTLGCSVARTLLGWGIRNMKFIDYGTVNYSNPVRQNLYTLTDCTSNNGTGKSKATAAADALKTIAPDVISEGITISIPMPGHPIDDADDKVKTNSFHETIETLDRLIYESDCVFLLTDTRESRWLPTVIAATYNKMLINAALGLDSWLVMRHGGGVILDNDGDERKQQSTNKKVRYGCYFCNDVVAPENSTKNRTLDQQCTVTRPGLAPIASSMAVEMMVSLLHHPDNLLASAPISSSNLFSPTGSSMTHPTTSNSSSSDNSSPLGIIPHQIRGSIVSYTMMTPTVPAFEQCTGCSKAIIDAYRTDKIELITKVCNSIDSTYLENLSGLTEFRNDAADMMGNNNYIVDDDDDDWES